jgi:IS30 family transposase
MTTTHAHKRIIRHLSTLPSGTIISSDQLAKELNQMPKTIGRSIRSTTDEHGEPLAEYIPCRTGGKWRKL